MKSYVLVGATAAVVTWATTFLVTKLAIRAKLVVAPTERGVHDRPLPTAGGAAMFAGFVVAMGLASQLPRFQPVFEGSSEPLGVLLAGSAMFFVGLMDDKREFSAPAKLAGQVLAGTILYFLGVTMFFFRVPFADFVVVSPDLAPLATVLWVIIISNAINLIDGLDGLAAGIVAIAAVAFFVYADRLSLNGLLSPDNVGPLVAVIAVGVCVGFLPHNFHPAKIIMGDAGALFLGLLLASSTLVVGGRTADQFSGQTFFFFAPVIIPFFILGVPIVDSAFAVVRRAVRRTKVSVADREHLHHRLMRLGHGQRRSVLILWAWTAILSGFVLFPTFTSGGNHVIPLGSAALGVALYTLFHPGIRQPSPETALVATTEVRQTGLRVVAGGAMDEPEPAPERPPEPDDPGEGAPSPWRATQP
jgi:UDP-GlcNAc:undecaprenyl-phosphate/decaprenyl-phosphate GlcNAc-1-phosphate transferase